MPELEDLLGRAHVVTLPMRVRFRGVSEREAVLIEGPLGWGEFGAFLEYGTAEASHWLASAIESAYGAMPLAHRDRIEINATVPAVPAWQVPEVLARFPGARTAKVKVAEPGQTLADDVARVNAVRAVIHTVRVDANGGWTLAEAVAAARALTADGPLEYLEQPCAMVDELAELEVANSGHPISAAEWEAGHVRDVLQYYGQNQQLNIVLDANEKVDLLAFLLTLTDREFLFNPDFSFPKKN